MASAIHFVSRRSEEFRAISTGLQQVLLVTDAEVVPGDQVVVRELAAAPDRYEPVHTELWLCRRVTHRLTSSEHVGVTPGWALLSLNTPAENEWSTTALQRRMRSFLKTPSRSREEFWRQLELEETARLRQLLRAGERPHQERSKVSA